MKSFISKNKHDAIFLSMVIVIGTSGNIVNFFCNLVGQIMAHYNLDGNLAALREYENRVSLEDAKQEAIEEIASSFINDVVSAIQCVMQNEIGIKAPDMDVEDILRNTHGDAFLEELAEYVLEKQSEEYQSEQECDL